jgi:hypothetical protein
MDPARRAVYAGEVMVAPDPARALLARIVDAAGQQLGLLEDARARPEVDAARLSQLGLELLMEAIASGAAQLDDPALRAFAERLGAHRAAGVDVRQHLVALSEGWACRRCGEDVAAGVTLDLRAPRAPKPKLRCKACGELSPIARAGHAAFKTKFGALIGPGWDPRSNGFGVER